MKAAVIGISLFLALLISSKYAAADSMDCWSDSRGNVHCSSSGSDDIGPSGW